MTDDRIIAQYEALTRRIQEVERENLVLRSLLSVLRLACVHCGAAELSRCARGFPGCAQADDLIAGTDTAVHALIAERNRLRARVAEAGTPEAIRAFVARVNARAELDILNGNPVTGAHHRALEEELRRL